MLFSVRFLGLWIYMYIYFECGKFRRSRAIVYLVCLVPSCHDALVGVSRVRDFFSWVFRGSDIFFVGIRGSKSFSRRCIMGPKFFLVSILWVQIFFSWVFCGFNFFSRGWFRDSKIFLSNRNKSRNAEIHLKPHTLF